MSFKGIIYVWKLNHAERTELIFRRMLCNYSLLAMVTQRPLGYLLVVYQYC
jgi:hypothetical protein